MPYSINWLIENEIVYVHYSGVMTVDDLRACLYQTHEYINSSPRAIIHTINDVGDITEQVPLKESMALIREVGTHPRMGWSFTIREKSSMIKMASGLGASVFKVRYRAFGTLEEAFEHLRAFDTAISWDKIDLSVTDPVRA